MAVPGNVLSGRNRGGHALIRDGAKIVETADDIVTELGLGAVPVSSVQEQAAPGVVRDPLLTAMDVDQAYDLDALAAATGLAAPRLLPRIAELELAGVLRRVDGGRFMRVR